MLGHSREEQKLNYYLELHKKTVDINILLRMSAAFFNSYYKCG